MRAILCVDYVRVRVRSHLKLKNYVRVRVGSYLKLKKHGSQMQGFIARRDTPCMIKMQPWLHVGASK